MKMPARILLSLALAAFLLTSCDKSVKPDKVYFSVNGNFVESEKHVYWVSYVDGDKPGDTT